jgi:hypothetical protein
MGKDAPKTGRTVRLAIRAMTLAAAVALIASIAWPGAVPSVRAMQPVNGGAIPAGVTVDDDVWLVNNDVTVDGAVNGDLIAVGERITVNGPVSGSAVLLGDTVTIRGQVLGGAYVAALNVGLGPRAAVGRSAYLVGVDVRTEPGSAVGRDITIGAYRATIGGQIERDLKTLAVLLDLQGQLRHGGRGPQVGLRRLVRNPDWAAWMGSGDVIWSVADVSRRPAGRPGVVDAPETEAAGSPLADWPGGFLRNMVILLLMGVLLLWLAPGPTARWTERIRTEALPAAGYGMLVFVVFYLAAAAVAALILVAGLVLALARLGGSVLPLYGFGFFGLGFALSTFTLFYSTVSQVILALVIGALVLRRVAPARAAERALALVVGATVLSAWVAAPIVGTAVSAVSGFMALGAAWLAHARRSESITPAAVAE